MASIALIGDSAGSRATGLDRGDAAVSADFAVRRVDIGPFLVTKRLLIGGVLTVVLVELLHCSSRVRGRAFGLPPWRRTTTPRLSLGVSVRWAIAVAWILGAVRRDLSARSCCCPVASCR